jgi:hypothetical protein
MKSRMRRGLIRFGIERKMSSLEHVDCRVRHVIPVSSWLTQIEREVVLAPKAKSFGCVFRIHACHWG